MVGLPDTITSSSSTGASASHAGMSGGTDSYYAPAGFVGVFNDSRSGPISTGEYD